MKNIVIILVFILISSLSIEAQQIKKNSNSKAKKVLVDSTKKSLISSDSSCNKMKNSCNKQNGNGQCRMKDKFIDNDSDGINDNRCKGMGIGCQKRKRNCGGKK
jgi:hypothetical protein